MCNCIYRYLHTDIFKDWCIRIYIYLSVFFTICIHIFYIYERAGECKNDKERVCQREIEYDTAHAFGCVREDKGAIVCTKARGQHGHRHPSISVRGTSAGPIILRCKMHTCYRPLLHGIAYIVLVPRILDLGNVCVQPRHRGTVDQHRTTPANLAWMSRKTHVLVTFFNLRVFIKE